MPVKISRRSFARGGAVATLSSFFIRRGARAAPPIHLTDTRIISPQPEYYCGWSTVALRRNGGLLVTWSGGREAHVCPFGQVHSMTSIDRGETWSWPRVLHDSAIDDRDSGCLETSWGSLLVTTFSSLAYEDLLEKQIHYEELSAKGWKGASMKPEQLARWKAAHARLDAPARKAELGEWLLRSTDGGLSWSPRIRTIVNSPHGPIQLRDGRLLYAGKQLWTEEKQVGVCESRDDGLSWQWLAGIPARKGDDIVKGYHELHAVEAADGTLVAQIRNHNKENAGWTLQSESADGGLSWTEPHPVCYGLPSHLLRLRDGRLLMTYGHRRAPFGNQARISGDHGKTWSEAMILSGDGMGGDLGYPSTVEFDDGFLLTVWYESMKEHPKAVLRQARWRLA